MANELINGVMQKVLRRAGDAAGGHHLQQEQQDRGRQEVHKDNKTDGISGAGNEVSSGDSANVFEMPALSSLPVGVIPAGSTDALVCTTTGAHCPLNSALHIVVG